MALRNPKIWQRVRVGRRVGYVADVMSNVQPVKYRVDDRRTNYSNALSWLNNPRTIGWFTLAEMKRA